MTGSLWISATFSEAWAWGASQSYHYLHDILLEFDTQSGPLATLIFYCLQTEQVRDLNYYPN